MDVFDAVKTVLAVRSYAQRSIPAEVVRRIVEAGRLSASAGNPQPWHFILGSNRDTVERIGGIMTPRPSAGAPPPVIAVLVLKGNRHATPDGTRAHPNSTPP